MREDSARRDVRFRGTEWRWESNGNAAGNDPRRTHAAESWGCSWSGFLLSEPLCVLLVALWTYSLFKSRASPGWLGVWAFVCGLTALTRPNMGLLFIFGLLWVRARSGPWLGRCLMATTIFLLTLLP